MVIGGELRAVTVDRSLLARLETKMIPSESHVLEALEVQLVDEETTLEIALADLVADCERLSFAPPVAIRVAEEGAEQWPNWSVQNGWPTDPPLLMFLRWRGALPVPEASSVAVPCGSVARSCAILQHWHTLGILSAMYTPRAELPSRGVSELLEDVAELAPQPGVDVKLDVVVSFQGVVIGRVRSGHVLFADCGGAKVLCKDRQIGKPHFCVLMHELHVGDVLHCSGFPGREYNGTPVLFVTNVLAIEPGKREQQRTDNVELYRDADFLVVEKPAGLLAHEDTRHRHERGTALRVEAAHLVAAPEIEVSGPAVFAWSLCAAPVHERRSYLALVSGAPTIAIFSANLRPRQGQPLEPAETSLEILWQGPDCSLVRATIEGHELPAQVRRHLHLLGCPVWGDRRFGNNRGNVRARCIYGLAKPWCHLASIELLALGV